MTNNNIFYCPYAFYKNAQHPLLKGATLYFDKLVILDPGGRIYTNVSTDHQALEAMKQLQDAGILSETLQGVTTI